ncbi:MAG: hypothetical protein CML30_00100 [Rhizobiales bacterium]|nr:hypothetical protein [Hoeflea sp.]MBA67247.1 hypothetical protein [Hyphomicrobiales bacterium]|tara:strand:- start:1237 stop:1428 length:192 start_codon:yes stop_codon:yes gene_type:complete
MSVIRCSWLFVLSGSTTFLGLSTVFGLYCLIGGHNFTEMLYGDFATYLLSAVAGVQFTLLEAE